MGWVLVAGPGEDASPLALAQAEAVGRSLALAGHVVLTGGLGGVMAAASRGAASVGGLAVGILPGEDRAAANRWVGLALTTGLGEMRNALLVRNADAVVAVGGAYGTLSEVALALRAGLVVAGLGTWDVEGVVALEDPDDAVALVVDVLGD